MELHCSRLGCQIERRREMKDGNLERLFGVQYLRKGVRAIINSNEYDAYTFSTYFGQHDVRVEQGDSLWWLSDEGTEALVMSGPAKVSSKIWATVIRGYRTARKQIVLSANTTLPYVNGCSTCQLFPPDRIGDPTLQLLKMPPYSSEQAHHIHNTVRIVYVFGGRRYSIVGMSDKNVKKSLIPGMLIVLDINGVHHFETEGE